MKTRIPGKGTGVAIGAAIALGLCTQTTLAGVMVNLEWLFDGIGGNEYTMLEGETVTVGLRAFWSDPSGTATAFGALNEAEFTIGGETGTSLGDAVANLARVNPFDFGPSALDGTVTSMMDGFLITGVSPTQNQFGEFGDTGSPSGAIWEFDFTAGVTGSFRTITLDLTGLMNALLFTQPLKPAIDVSGGLVQAATGTIFVDVPAPGAIGFFGAALLVGRRRRRLR